ncbi:MAG: hypothetical protein ACF8Q5_12960 [Phycisphaerales bacterium JB040]
MTRRTVAPLALLTASLALPGCIIVADSGPHHYDRSDYNQVTTHEMDELVRANREARLGMDQATVLGLYPDDLTTLKGSGLDNGVEVEAWRVSAVTRNGDLSFTRWLYFYDGRLVELRDDRIDWDDEDRLASWRAH